MTEEQVRSDDAEVDWDNVAGKLRKGSLNTKLLLLLMHKCTDERMF